MLVQKFLAARSAAVLSIAMAIACAGEASATSVDTSHGPINIKSCGVIVNSTPSSGTTTFGIPLSEPSSGMQIDFVNTSGKTIKAVLFAVSSNGDKFTIRDFGTFSPGVTISKTYDAGAGESYVAGTFSSHDLICRVAAVKFDDGSIWRAAAVTPL